MLFSIISIMSKRHWFLICLMLDVEMIRVLNLHCSFTTSIKLFSKKGGETNEKRGIRTGKKSLHNRE